MPYDNLDCTVTFPLTDGPLPLNLAKAIIESDILKGKDFREFIDYLSVHERYHCQHGLATTKETLEQSGNVPGM